MYKLSNCSEIKKVIKYTNFNNEWKNKVMRFAGLKNFIWRLYVFST